MVCHFLVALTSWWVSFENHNHRVSLILVCCCYSSSWLKFNIFIKHSQLRLEFLRLQICIHIWKNYCGIDLQPSPLGFLAEVVSPVLCPGRDPFHLDFWGMISWFLPHQSFSSNWRKVLPGVTGECFSGTNRSLICRSSTFSRTMIVIILYTSHVYLTVSLVMSVPLLSETLSKHCPISLFLELHNQIEESVCLVYTLFSFISFN